MGRTITMLRVPLAPALLALMIMTGAASAEEKKEVGGLVRITIMVPLLDPKTGDIARIAPVIIDITATTDEAKNTLTNKMANLQDACMEATYGNVSTTVSYNHLAEIVRAAVERVAGEDYKGQYEVVLRVNVRPNR